MYEVRLVACLPEVVLRQMLLMRNPQRSPLPHRQDATGAQVLLVLAVCYLTGSHRTRLWPQVGSQGLPHSFLSLGRRKEWCFKKD